MKSAILIAAAVVGTVFGATGSLAQSGGISGIPAETPPASFDGKQFADSRGCLYTRADIDGTIVWVPRVDRSRKQICGHPPTFPSQNPASTATAGPADPSPVISEPAPVSAQAVAPKPAAPAPHPVPAGVPARTAPSRVSPAVAAAPRTRTVVVRDGQTQRTVQMPVDTRVVLRRVDDARQNTRNVVVPKGYRAVWKDDRLNPHRTEISLHPQGATNRMSPPKGYTFAWTDNRLNPKRGQTTQRGDAQTDRLWTRTVPRTLLPVPGTGQVVIVNTQPRRHGGSFWQPRLPDQPQNGLPVVTRLSTRSDSAGFRPKADR